MKIIMEKRRVAPVQKTGMGGHGGAQFAQGKGMTKVRWN